ncbi:DMT family transporter [Micromonospora sp. NPDC050200]|uniref:DMT family transporter n=1 Tax=Micromonospora sp. NPDC050200 TaxID=3155664 RepID=UPI0033C9D362
MATRSVVRMAVLALLWGSGFLWIKIALAGGLTPSQVTAVRCALGAVVLLTVAVAAGQRLPRGRRVWAHLVVAALFCNALPFLLVSTGERTLDSGVAGVLHATTPLWSLLFGLLLGTERHRHPSRLAGLLLGFTGVLLIFAPWRSGDLTSRGALLVLAAAASYAVAFAYMARYLADRSAPMALSAAQLLAATALTTLTLPADPGPWRMPGPAALAAVAVLGTLGTGVTFHLNARLIADEGPTAAAVVGYLLPVVAVGLGALVLDEALTARVVAGMVVVLLGVALTRASPSSGLFGRDGDGDAHLDLCAVTGLGVHGAAATHGRQPAPDGTGYPEVRGSEPRIESSTPDGRHRVGRPAASTSSSTTAEAGGATSVTSARSGSARASGSPTPP